MTPLLPRIEERGKERIKIKRHFETEGKSLRHFILNDLGLFVQ